MKTILKFIRITNAGTFELVHWTRDQEGKKHCEKTPVKPTPEQLREIINNKYNELLIPNSSN